MRARLHLSRSTLLLAVAMAAQLMAVGAVNAATPASGTVGPANGSTTAWNFAAVGPGASSGGTVEFVCPPVTCDAYTLNVVLPAADTAFYTNHIATLTLTYTWTSTGPDDMDIFAFAPDGTESGPGSPDEQSTGAGKEVLAISNPASG